MNDWYETKLNSNNSKLNILFLSNRGLLPIKDGHTRRSFNILKGLSEGNKISYVSLFERPEEVSSFNIEVLKKYCQYVEFHPAPKKCLSIQMVSRLTRSLLSFEPYTIWRHYSKSYEKRVNELIASGKFDIVHCDTLPISYTILPNNKTFKSITDHDVSYLKCQRIAHESRNFALKAFLYLEALKLKRLERNIFKYVDVGITVSEKDRDALSRLCPEAEFIVIENGVELDKFIPAYDSIDKNRLVWVGGFDHYPNRHAVYNLLENIYPKIKKKISKVTLDIVGGGAPDKLKRLVASDSSINLIGYVDDPIPFIQRAAVFLMPIYSGGGTKLKALEAMAAGKAIVSTMIGCEGLECIDGQHCLIANDDAIFANSVIKLLENDCLRIEIGKRSRRLAIDKFDWNKICGRLNDYYLTKVKH